MPITQITQLNSILPAFTAKDCRTKSPDHLRVFRNQDIYIKGLFHQMTGTGIPCNPAGKKDRFID